MEDSLTSSSSACKDTGPARPHMTLRHTFFYTMLVLQKADIVTAKVLMGSANTQATLNIYTRFDQGHLEEAVKQLADFFRHSSR
jgi:site-specific recombinase XerD